MKKITLLAGMALTAAAASAQYSVDPSTSIVAEQNPKTVEYIVLSEGGINDLKKAGATLTYIGPDAENGRNLWYWENTFSPGDESYPRVDMEEGGYISVVVGTVGWSGAGVACSAPGISTMNINDDTHFHIAYMTPSNNGPSSIALILFDGDLTGSSPAKIALGDAFVDNGAVYPSVGPKITDDWQGVDITLGTIKKLYPTFNVVNSDAWLGNVFSWLGGGVTGESMAFDALYFYNTEDSGVNDIIDDAVSNFVVTGNTINVMNGQGVELYNLSGQKIKSTTGSTLGITGLQKGIYIARSGNKVAKVNIK